MSADPPTAVRLFRMLLKQDPDVVLCRNRARLVAEKFGFDRQDQIRVATAVSEIARNAFRYAKGAAAEFFLEPAGKAAGKRGTQRMSCFIQDEGPGISNLEEIMSGRYKSQTGLGMGITGAHRLMDKVSVETGPSGTTVHLSKVLPKGKSFSAAEVQAIGDAIMGPAKASPLEEMANQNNEMLFMLQEVSVKGEELSKVNEELSETNRGVVALYDELDTVYRVGHVLASKLELHELLEAIINATTDICGAEVGMFIYEEKEEPEGGKRSAQQHWAGPLSASLRQDLTFPLHRLLGSTSQSPNILRIDDLEKENRLPAPLGGTVPLRSYLAIPVLTTSGLLSGAMVFAHRQPSVFTERSERILSSVALQSTISIENARLYKSVQSASAAKDHFLATLSHELRNPLNPVFMRLTLLEENPAMPADALEDVRLIRRNLELETRLIDDLLDMTRIVRGKVSMKPAPVSLHEVIDAARDACSGTAEEQGVKIVLELEAPAFHVMGDAVRLQQVFWNLFNNALKFSSRGSEVHVRTTGLSGRRIRTTVSDSGRGISSGRMEAIFEPFEQESADTATEYGGLGLGLAISKSIVNAHSGEITAHSEGEGRGATFTVSLHLSSSQAVAPTEQLPDDRTAQAAKYKILLVDDHRDTRSALQTLLQRRGHDVSIAANCAEARAMAGKESFELLISDIGLPDGSGYGLMESLRGQKGLRGIAVSGYGMTGDIDHSRTSGFAMHLIKPLRIQELEKAISAVMREDFKTENNC